MTAGTASPGQLPAPHTSPQPATPGPSLQAVERDVLAWFAELFRAPSGWSGYLTGGSTEGNRYGLRLARAKLPNAVVYHSGAAHPTVSEACRLLGLPTAVPDAALRGELDYASLREHLGRYRARPAIVVANVGTSMTEGVDQVSRIHAELDAAGITHRWIHADAALAGIPLALTGRRDFDLAGGSDSIAVSAHNIFGLPLPCGVAMSCRPLQDPGRPVGEIGSHDTTIVDPRSALAALMLWHAISQHDLDGHRRRVEQARDVAAYACQRLGSIGWPHWRNLQALTVVLRPLPEVLRQRWPLRIEGRWSHLICVPGITTHLIDTLIDDLKES
jgi:histidine decarboxylase